MLDRVKTATDNLIRAIEAGIFNDAPKARMEELDAQRGELEAALADAGLVSGLRLTQDHIRFFLLQFRQMDFDEPDSQRRIIDIFINAVFVYDDKVTLTFNYSGDHRTITLAEVDAAAQGVHGPSGVGHQKESPDFVVAFLLGSASAILAILKWNPPPPPLHFPQVSYIIL